MMRRLIPLFILALIFAGGLWYYRTQRPCACSCSARVPEAACSDDVFAASEMHRERVQKRLEIAARLKRPEFAGHPMREADLEGFQRYYEEELALWKVYPGNPAVKATELKVTDFGAVGDGKTANDAAFVRAAEAVRALNGRPSILRIPAGEYYFAGRKGALEHVNFTALTNCLVTGEGPKLTRFVYGEIDAMGVRFDACCNSTLANVEMYWKTCPFSQGVVEKVEKNAKPRSLVIRHDPTTKRPDDPHFRKVNRAKVCGTFDAVGHQVKGCPLFFDTTDPVPAEDLGGGLFRIKLDPKHKTSYNEMNVKVGMTVVLPDRVNNTTAVRAHQSHFCNFDSVWIRNSPEAAFTTGGEYISAWKCRVFPLKAHHRLSTNADAFFNSPGTFLGRCEFRNMNDDGANSHYSGVPLTSADAKTRTLRFAQRGISAFAQGEPVQIYRAKTGELLSTLHVERSRIVTEKGGRVCEVTVREPLPGNLMSVASLGIGELTSEQRYALSHGVGAKPKEFADVVYAPHGRGLGYVVTGCTIADFRGIAVNSQCPNALIENNLFEHCNHGLQVSSLMMWYEGLPCYNLLVRNNVMRHTHRGVNGYLSTVDGSPCKTDYIRGVLLEGNTYESVVYPVRFRNFRDVVVKDAVTPDFGENKRLEVRALSPARVTTNAVGRAVADFGSTAFGWLELTGSGPYEIVIGEMTNAEGRVTNPYPGSTIRVQTLTGAAFGSRCRVPMTPDSLNLKGYKPACPAIRLPEEFGIVFPFRFAEIVRAPCAPRDLVQKAVSYPIDMTKSSFECSEPDLVKLYAFCKETIRATSFCGIYVDGDRERTPYEADAYINQLCHYAIDDDTSLARRSHEWLMAHPTWPTEWKQHSIMIAWADWMWSGDASALARWYGELATRKLDAGCKIRADGLLVSPGGGDRGERDIVDWPECERDGYELTTVNTVVNAFRYRNLCEMSQIALALDKKDDAARFSSQAVRLKSAFEKAFFRPTKGLYADGETTDHISLHANAAALAFGLVPKAREKKVADFLEKKGLACSVYFAQYYLEALYAAGRDETALRLMLSHGDRSWLGMIDFGSSLAMEAWNVRAKPNLDLNHAWGAVPLNIIARYVLGVTPLEPGFAKISIAPRPASLKTVKGVVPTVRGPVAVSIARGKLSVTVPAPARVVWNGQTHDVTPGRYVFD